MKKICISRSKVLFLLYTALIAIGVTRTYINSCVDAALPMDKKVIVIDAGHGGWDPGKVASDGTREKEINLKIAEYLKGYLLQGGAQVESTRISDEALSQNKRQDLKNRVDLANGKNVDIFVSIHQNSFPQGSVKGAQVFYYKNSEKGKKLAELIQSRLKQVVDVENARVPKPNVEYYLLKEAKIPSVIVECGFLSNAAEHDKLLTPEYQQKIAWAIYMGILDYCQEAPV